MKKILDDILLKNIRSNFNRIKEVLEDANSHWGYEDNIYKFYHRSFKVYIIQKKTEAIVELLKSLAPEGVSFNKFFEEIFKEGTGKKFDYSHNKNWTKITRPLLEAFFHANFFLEMAFKYGKELEKTPQILPSGWAAFLYFYNLR